MQPVRREVSAPDSLELELVRVPAGAPVTLDLRMESVVEGVLVSGTVTAPVSGECGRCLEPVSDEITVDIQELFAYPESATDTTSDAEEVRRLSGDLLDLEPVLRDAVVLDLPLSPLCRADCRGLCPSCGVRWDDLPDDHSHQTLDPRWAALTERFGTSTTDSQER
ncbi:MAG TPA: YceD family protein [Mycobacteriales bacterium]|nr:YceD family protein [Mycobacteriales bacterium]